MLEVHFFGFAFENLHKNWTLCYFSKIIERTLKLIKIPTIHSKSSNHTSWWINKRTNHMLPVLRYSLNCWLALTVALTYLSPFNILTIQNVYKIACTDTRIYKQIRSSIYMRELEQTICLQNDDDDHFIGRNAYHYFLRSKRQIYMMKKTSERRKNYLMEFFLRLYLWLLMFQPIFNRRQWGFQSIKVVRHYRINSRRRQSYTRS